MFAKVLRCDVVLGFSNVSSLIHVFIGVFVSLIQILAANSQSLRGRALSHSSLRGPVKHDEPTHQLDDHMASDTAMI